MCVLSHVWLCGSMNCVACQASLSMGFSRQEYRSGLPCPPPGALPDPGIEPCLLCPQHWLVGSFTPEPPGKLDFSRQEYWSGLPFRTPGDLPDKGLELTSLAYFALAGRFFTTSATWKAVYWLAFMPGTMWGILSPSQRQIMGTSRWEWSSPRGRFYSSQIAKIPDTS